MKAAVPMKKRVNWPLRILIVAGALFVFVKTVQLYAQIVEKREIIDHLQTEVNNARLYNEDLEEKLNGDFAGYLEERLRKDGFVHPNDQIYQFVN